MYLTRPDSKAASRLLPQFPCEYALSCQLVAPGTEQQHRDVYLAEKYKNKLSGCIKIQLVNQSSINFFFCDEIIISGGLLCARRDVVDAVFSVLIAQK